MTLSDERPRWVRAARGMREAASLWWRWYGRRPRPRGITAIVTDRCDLRCRHCECGVPCSEVAELPLDMILGLVDLAGDLRVELLLTGGEPSLHTGFWDILARAQRRRARVELNTNGYTLAEADAAKVALLNATVSLLRVSVDSADPDEHDAWRGVAGSQARALRLLRDPRLACRREISVVLALDLHNAAPLIAMAQDVRCPITFQPLIFGANSPSRSRSPWKAAQQSAMPALAAGAAGALSALIREADDRGVRTNLRVLQSCLEAYYRAACGSDCYVDRAVPRFRCVIPYRRLTIDERGRIVPCVFLAGGAALRQGDLLGQWKSAAAAWRGGTAPATRHSACRSCGCYFAENRRASAALHPVANRRQLLALLREADARCDWPDLTRRRR